MSQDLNNQFRAGPFKFAQRYPLMPGGAASMPTNGPGMGLKTGPNDSLYKIKGGSRIVGIDLESEGSKVVIKRKAAGLVVEAPAMAAYWLPWSEDQLVRITLRKPRDQALRGTKTPINENPPNPGAMPPQDTNDPDVFFTAGVNGCMVVVEGTREEPTVYHCNAMRVGQSPMDASITDRNADEAKRRILEKAGAMTDRVKDVSATIPKTSAGTAAPRKGVIHSDYMLLAANNQLGAGQEQEWGKIREEIAQIRGIQKLSDKAIRIDKSQGTIFGVRRDGKWMFYYQKLVCYEVWKDQGWVTSNWQKEPGEFWHVAECRHFWPTGGGHVL